MKILVVGDFHGKFSPRLFKLAKEVDLVVSLGDYPDWELRKIFFEECYRIGQELWEVVGKKKYKESKLRDWATAERIMKKLNSLKTPVITTVGNYDAYLHDALDVKKKKGAWKWDEQNFFEKSLAKFPHIKRVDYRTIKIGDFIFVGALGHSFPGKVKSKSYKRHRKKLEKFFTKYSKENSEGRLIFVTHNVPYNTKLDKIRDKNAPAAARGKHFGSKLFRRIIDKYQPIMSLSGHMHENQGKTRIGKTVAINAGAALEDKATLVELELNKKGMGIIKKVKFL